MSFLLAQAFSFWFAQTHMGLSYVVHVRGAEERFSPARNVSAMKPGAGPMKPRARPDFIGRGAGQYHVFESKGRSRPLSAASLAGALAQASMITTINGSVPATRVAACFSFGSLGVTGRVQDPEADVAGYDLHFDDVTAVRKVYAFFLEPEIRDSSTELVPGFRGVEIGDDLLYGVDAKVLAKFEEIDSLTGKNRTVEPLLELLNERQEVYSERRAENTSVGNDGILLKGNNTIPPRRSSQRRRKR